jgi:hypothetical protein
MSSTRPTTENEQAIGIKESDVEVSLASERRAQDFRPAKHDLRTRESKAALRKCAALSPGRPLSISSPSVPKFVSPRRTPFLSSPSRPQLPY